MKRSTLYLLGILILLCIVAYYVLRRPGEMSSTGTTGTTLVDFDSAAVDKLEIRSPDRTVVLEKEAGKWMMTLPLRYRADDNVVATAVGKGKRIELKSLVSTNPQKRQLFQLDSAGTQVKVYERGTVKATFHVGKPSTSYTETYVRLENSDEVYLADGLLTYMFVRQPKEWRDKTIFKAESDRIPGVTFHYGDTTFSLALRDSTWRIGEDSVSLQSARSFIGTLSNVQADDFVDSTIATLPKITAALEIGGTQLRFLFNEAVNKYYVQTSESPQLFEILPWRATQLLKRKKDFLPSP